MTRFVRLEARRRAAIVAVAVERYRLSHEGRLPEELKLLTPQFLREVPDDPLDLADPVRLKPLTPGFVVYSVGVDGTDDGGKERTNQKNVTGFDETFFVER